MRLIAEQHVRSDEMRRIQLFQGDLTAVPAQHACDVLVVSAFEGNYAPTRGTLVRALHDKGISVAKLAFDKEEDLRKDFCCWLSKELVPPVDGVPFKRILGFEPEVKGKAPKVVGDIFRALDPFVHGPFQVRSVALPVVAAGNQGYSHEAVLPPLFDAAWNRLSEGYPLRTIKIVAHGDDSARRAERVFRKHIQRRERPSIFRRAPDSLVADQRWKARYDVFVSYSRRDKVAATHVANALRRQGIKVFIDESEIDTGASWQQRIFDALEQCRSAVALYSPHFTNSKVCQDEFSIAMILRRRRGENFIHPILTKDTDLPAYMEMLSYDDCRIDDLEKLQVSAARLAARLSKS